MSGAPEQDKKVLATYGPKGARVRVILHDATTVRAEWYAGPKGHKLRRVKDWPATVAGKKEAKAWAKGFSEARTIPGAPERYTLRSVWEKYALAEFEHLRAATRGNYAEHWRYWERTWGREFEIRQTTPEMVDEFRTAMGKRGISVSYLGKIITTIKQIYRFARLRGYIPVNPIGDYRYKVAKDKRPKPIPEYSQAEFDRIMAQLDPEDGREWRAYVGLSLCGWQGVRENAVVHLAWADVDEDAGMLTWRARYDKMGNEWKQPIRPQTRAALDVARRWREKLKYSGPWVIPAGNVLSKRDGSYSPQSLIASLRTAELRAKVKYIKKRGPHSLRRMLAGDVAEATGDPVLAMRSIGDTDIRQAGRYILKRDDPIRAAFDAVDRRRNPGSGDAHRHPTATSPENDTSAVEGRSLEVLTVLEDTTNEN